MFSEHRSTHRPPAVAGQFYPAEPTELDAMVRQMLQQAAPSDRSHIKALIVPHAGYIYSGPVAASVYHSLRAQADVIERVILLGPSHYVGFYGLATSSADFFTTPLGEIRLDRELIARINELAQVQELDRAHEREHSLEVQLPFLQEVLQDFDLVPIVVGDCPADQVAEVIQLCWGGAETLLVISSDLSHYHSYDEARIRDQKTSDAILNLDPTRIHYEDACGRNPVNGLLLAARDHRLCAELIDLRNSGDTAGSRDRVVGYGGYLFSSDV